MARRQVHEPDTKTEVEGDGSPSYDRDHVLMRASRYCVSKCRTIHTNDLEMSSGEVAGVADLWQ
jgi:hypothetical protein